MKCRYQSGEGNGVVVLHREGWGTYTHGWEILSSYVYYFFSSNLARGRSVTLNWDEHVGGLARSPSLDMCHWLVRSGWFHRWVMFTLSLQGKGFLEGTTLPPIMTYWGLAELPGKKENTHSEIWSKHSHFQHSTHWHEHVQCLTGSQQFCAVVGFLCSLRKPGLSVICHIL